MRLHIRSVALALLACALAAPAEARVTAAPAEEAGPPRASRMAEGRRVMEPIPHLEFCARNATECESPGYAPAVVLTPARWAELARVNARVNRSIRPVHDAAGPRGADSWSLVTSAGDCEDYAIRKRHDLIAAGWPASSVLLAVVRERSGASHAVAVVRTASGDFVLDNLTPRIRGWEATGYTWVKRQSAASPRIWVRVEKAAPPVPKPKPVIAATTMASLAREAPFLI